MKRANNMCFKEYVKWMVNANIFLYSICLSVICFFIKALISVLKNGLKIPDIQFREKLVNENFKVTVDLLIDTLFFAPILETLVFQTFFYYVFDNWIKIKKKWIIALISGAAFGLYHNYSIFYIIDTTIIGFVFMYLYVARAEVGNQPFKYTMMAHFAVNFIIFINVLIAHYYKFGTWF